MGLERGCAFADRVHEFLTNVGYDPQAVTREEHVDLERRWAAIYGCAIRAGEPPCLVGASALRQYPDLVAREFYVAPFLSAVLSPSGATDHLLSAYSCRGPNVRDLSELMWIADFFVTPIDLSWTMVHTHEDEAHFPGPIFVRAEWLES